MTSKRKRLEKIIGPQVVFQQRLSQMRRELRATGWPPQEPTPLPEPPQATPPDERCTFCGARAVKSERVRGNPEQVLFCCRAESCLAQWRPLVADVPAWRPGKRRRRRRPRQKTHDV